MNKEQLESEIKRLRSELFELRVEYKDLLRKYTKVSDELLLIKAGAPKQIKEEYNDNIRSK